NREKDSNDQGEIEDRKAGKRPGKERLQQNRRQRHQERNGRGEAMLFELSAGCVAACGHEDSCQFPVVSCSLSVGAGLNPVGPPVYEAWQGLVAWGIAWKWRVADLYPGLDCSCRQLPVLDRLLEVSSRDCTGRG